MERIYVPRQIEPLIVEAASQFPSVVLTGPRQTGKSTLLKHCFTSHRYVSLDDPVTRRACTEDPALFLENYPPPCIIDEVQYAPQLLPYIKIQIDENRTRNGQYLLTGSQIFPLMKGLTESLAGRTAVLELQGFSMEEYSEHEQSVSDLFTRIFLGGYPDPLVHKVNRDLFYSSYVQTYLERDVRHVENVQDLSLFGNLLELLAARAGSLLNKSELAKELGVSQTTVKRWVSLLENSRIIYLMRPYSRNISKRIVKSPKIYFFDTGLLSYLLKYPDSRTLSAGPMNGPMLENFVITELLKKKRNRNLPVELYFYRDSNRTEIDLVVDHGYRQDICEVKLSKTVQSKHYKQLRDLQSLFSDPSLYLISAYDKRIKLTGEVRNIPVWETAALLGD